MSGIGARRVVARGSIALIAVLLGACGPAATVAPTPTGAPPSSAPSTAAGPVELCATTPGVGCDFNAGDFKSTRFTGGVTFHLIGDNTWTNTANEPDVIVLQIGASGGFGQTGDPSTIVLVHGAPRLKSGASVAAVSDPEQAKAALAAIDGLTLTPVATPAAIDGQAGVVFRVSNTGAAKVVLWQYPTTTGAGSYDLPAGASTEVHWLTIDGSPVIVAFLAPGNGLDAFLLDGDPIIKSIHFGD
jgi:hypothetical protein